MVSSPSSFVPNPWMADGIPNVWQENLVESNGRCLLTNFELVCGVGLPIHRSVKPASLLLAVAQRSRDLC